MPNRYLRASYIDSRSINALSAEGERMFIRLVVHVDDFGRCEADPDLLRGKLFARQLDTITAKHVAKWIEDLARVGLLQIYVAEGNVFLQMAKWERGRASASKCPQPPTDANKCFQMFTDANKCLQMFTRENISPDSDSDSDPDPDPEYMGVLFEEFWKAWPKHPRKVNKTGCRKIWRSGGLEQKAAEVMDGLKAWTISESWRRDLGQWIPRPETWLRQQRWLDTEAASARTGGTAGGYAGRITEDAKAEDF